MKILALESSATACSVALCEDEALIAQSFQNNGLTHSRTLMPMAVSLLDNCGTALDAVELIAVAAGPDRKSTRLNSSHIQKSRMPSSA